MTSSTSVRCRCGTVKINFSSSYPRFSAECCWSDRYHELKLLEERGGPSLAETAKNGERGAAAVDEVYFENRLNIDRGNESVICVAMFKESKQTALICARCYTHLVGQHSLFQGNVVSVYTGLQTLSGINIPRHLIRWCDDDWVEDESGSLDPSIPAVWFDARTNNLTGSGNWERAVTEAFGKFREPIAEEVSGEWCTYDDIVRASLQDGVQILGEEDPKPSEYAQKEEPITAMCQCGTVTVTFASESPTAVTECCANEIYSRIDILEQRGGAPMPEHIRKRRRPVTVAYFNNAITVAGEENVRFVKMNEDDRMTLMICRECLTHLVGCSSIHLGNAVCAYPDLAQMSGPELPPPSIRFSVNEWNEEARNGLEPLPSLWVDPATGNLTGSDGWAKDLVPMFHRFHSLNYGHDRGESLPRETHVNSKPFRAFVASSSENIELLEGGQLPDRSLQRREGTFEMEWPRTTCQCGKLAITFPFGLPRASVEKCSKDLYSRIEILANRSGRDMPEDIKTRKAPVTVVYMDNRLLVEGRENLKFLKTDIEDRMTVLICASCLTHLVGCSALFAGNAVSIYPDLAQVTGMEIPPATIRIDVDAWEAEQLNRLNPLPGVWTDEVTGDITGSTGWMPTMAAFLDALREPPSKLPSKDAVASHLFVSQCETFASLLAGCSEDVELLVGPSAAGLVSEASSEQ